MPGDERAQHARQRVAVVTGAAGELGSAVARRLLADGYRIAALDRAADALARAMEPLAEWGGDVHRIVVDQTDRAAVDRAVGEVTQTLGPPWLVVANAGYARFGGFLEMAPVTFERHVAVNLTGTFHVCQATARAMAEAQRGGVIVVVSSSLALAHADAVGAYCVTKAALLPLVHTMAAELGVYDIRVNALLPGVVRTAMTEPMLGVQNAEQGLLASTPLGRLGAPSDVSDCVAFLASEQASWVTGAAIRVDGGQALYGQPQWVRQDRTTRFAPRWVRGLGTPDEMPREAI
jgi:NAD(P)-dependent dehydrogenase (short-subunit alcohol dehydrogenase family)